MTLIAIVVISVGLPFAAALGTQRFLSIVRERDELRVKFAEVLVSNAKLEREKQDLAKKVSAGDAEKSRLLSRILDWEKYTAKLEPRMIDAEGKVAEMTALGEYSGAEIANMRAEIEALYEMLDRYGNAKVTAEILQELIDLLKKAQAKAA